MRDALVAIVSSLVSVVFTVVILGKALDYHDASIIKAGYTVIDGKAYKITPVSP